MAVPPKIEEAPAWTLVAGASWLDEEGRGFPVRGFHEEWIAAHPELTGRFHNVCEVVLARRWISVTLYGGGYLELMVSDRHDPEVRARILRLLGPSRAEWEKALVIAMDEEGYEMLERSDLEDASALDRALDRHR